MVNVIRKADGDNYFQPSFIYRALLDLLDQEDLLVPVENLDKMVHQENVVRMDSLVSLDLVDLVDHLDSLDLRDHLDLVDRMDKLELLDREESLDNKDLLDHVESLVSNPVLEAGFCNHYHLFGYFLCCSEMVIKQPILCSSFWHCF